MFPWVSRQLSGTLAFTFTDVTNWSAIFNFSLPLFKWIHNKTIVKVSRVSTAYLGKREKDVTWQKRILYTKKGCFSPPPFIWLQWFPLLEYIYYFVSLNNSPFYEIFLHKMISSYPNINSRFAENFQRKILSSQKRLALFLGQGMIEIVRLFSTESKVIWK